MSSTRTRYSADFVFNQVEQLGSEPLRLSLVRWQHWHLCDLAEGQALPFFGLPQFNGKGKNVTMSGELGRSPL